MSLIQFEIKHFKLVSRCLNQWKYTNGCGNNHLITLQGAAFPCWRQHIVIDSCKTNKHRQFKKKEVEKISSRKLKIFSLWCRTYMYHHRNLIYSKSIILTYTCLAEFGLSTEAMIPLGATNVVWGNSSQKLIVETKWHQEDDVYRFCLTIKSVNIWLFTTIKHFNTPFVEQNTFITIQ